MCVMQKKIDDKSHLYIICTTVAMLLSQAMWMLQRTRALLMQAICPGHYTVVQNSYENTPATITVAKYYK